MADDGAAVGDWEPRSSDGRAVNITVGEREGIIEGDIKGGDEMGISVGIMVDSVEGSEEVRCGGSGAGSPFPLGFGRQRKVEIGSGAEPTTKVHGSVPTDAHDWLVGGVDRVTQAPELVAVA